MAAARVARSPYAVGRRRASRPDEAEDHLQVGVQHAQPGCERVDREPDLAARRDIGGAPPTSRSSGPPPGTGRRRSSTKPRRARPWRASAPSGSTTAARRSRTGTGTRVVSAPPACGTDSASALSSRRFVTRTSPCRAVSRANHHDASGWIRRPWPGYRSNVSESMRCRGVHRRQALRQHLRVHRQLQEHLARPLRREARRARDPDGRGDDGGELACPPAPLVRCARLRAFRSRRRSAVTGGRVDAALLERAPRRSGRATAAVPRGVTSAGTVPGGSMSIGGPAAAAVGTSTSARAAASAAG